jgi:hypothetical protein
MQVTEECRVYARASNEYWNAGRLHGARVHRNFGSNHDPRIDAMMLQACRENRQCRHIGCICDEDPTLIGTTFSTKAELKRLSTIRTQGNPYPPGSDSFEAFELCRRPAF